MEYKLIQPKKIYEETSDRLLIVIKENRLKPGDKLLSVQLASTFDSEIKAIKGEKSIEAKNIMNIMSIGSLEGDEVTLSVQCEERQKVPMTLENFLLNVE
ncbi:HPr family phosphocarrier protein [Priestia sp. P5]|uniref:HPr family phosphocarrier protein n=1 Tax=Priestia sp. P5 TaxID=2917806 RepID=UPI002405043C|nr:HPr family phosphocarrier protein [Priestia sp. P5]